jgi:hypothetical protein
VWCAATSTVDVSANARLSARLQTTAPLCGLYGVDLDELCVCAGFAARQRRLYEANKAKRAHMQEFIDKFRCNANRAALVQSRIKVRPCLRP